MTEKIDPYDYFHTDSGDTNVCTCGGYKPTRREYFTAVAFPQAALWVDTYGIPIDSKQVMAARHAVIIADELIKSLDKKQVQILPPPQLTTNQGETMTLTVQDLVTKLDDFADNAKIKVKRFYLLQETSITRDVVDIKKDDDGNVVLIEEDLSIRHDGRKASEDEESEGEESEDKESEGEESEGEE